MQILNAHHPTTIDGIVEGKGLIPTRSNAPHRIIDVPLPPNRETNFVGIAHSLDHLRCYSEESSQAVLDPHRTRAGSCRVDPPVRERPKRPGETPIISIEPAEMMMTRPLDACQIGLFPTATQK